MSDQDSSVSTERTTILSHFKTSSTNPFTALMFLEASNVVDTLLIVLI